MRIKYRLERLEDRLQVGTNKDGTCRYCTGRERELGQVVVVYDPPEREQDTARICRGWRRANPPPTLCPRCGKDMNTTVVVTYVDLIAKRRAEGGWLDAAQERDRGRLDE